MSQHPQHITVRPNCRETVTALAAVAVMLAALAPLPANAQPASARPGVVADSLASGSDPGQMHAVYLPSSYDPARTWPVLFLMDPRGRASLPLQQFREIADSLGYILVSSYNTMSDGPEEPNVRALNAMLADAGTTWSVDSRRFYLVGFSGTARLSWSFAYQIPDNVAGVIGFGAGTAHGMVPAAKIHLEGKPFSFYGGSGHHDFNALELIELEEHLETLGFPHKIVFYPGSHSWPQEERWYRDALSWMHLQAMQKKLIETDTTFVRRYYASSLRQIGEANNVYDEYKGLQDLMHGFGELVEHPGEVTEQYERVGRSRGYNRLREQLEELVKEYRDYNVRATRILEGLLEDRTAPNAESLIRRLDVEGLKARAADTSSTFDSRTARVMLELAYVKATFYIPRELLRQERPEQALLALQVAEGILGPNFNTHLFHALAFRMLDERERALEHLRALLEMGIPADYLERMPQLADFRGVPGFQALLEEYRDGS